MKKNILILLMVLISFPILGQDIDGVWSGVLKIQGISLKIVFNINKTADSYTSTLDSPNQGVRGIAVSSVIFKDQTVLIAVSNAGIVYKGTWKDSNTIDGIFEQYGQSFLLNLKKEINNHISKRPQEPLKPYSYNEEEVCFASKDSTVMLAGTLTFPQKNGTFPVVILISGSGPQNRNSELMEHKPFLVLSDYLTQKGIAVLRFDDRGIGSSTGDFKSATSLDFAKDVEGAIAFLKTRDEIDKKRIGLIGHSEGAIIASIVAGSSRNIAFIVLLGGYGLPGERILLTQQRMIGRISGVDSLQLYKAEKINTGAFHLVKGIDDPNLLKEELTKYFKIKNVPASVANPTISQLVNPWMNFFIKYDPCTTLSRIKCPVLALNGTKDLQVSPKENQEAISRCLSKGGNRRVTIKELSGLNHLFQECKTGLPTEYYSIEQTFSPIALTEISKWIENL